MSEMIVPGDDAVHVMSDGVGSGEDVVDDAADDSIYDDEDNKWMGSGSWEEVW